MTGADDGISSQPIRVRGSSGVVVLGLRGRVAEIVEHRDLLLAEAPHRIVGGEVGDQLAHPRPDLEREVGRRRPDEGLDVVDGRLGHRAASLTTSVSGDAQADLRRGDAAVGDRAVGAQPHGQPLHPHARVPAARLLDRALRRSRRSSSSAIALVAERSLRIARRDLARASGARPLVLCVNQIGFVYALKTTSASVIALILAATPIFAALIGLAFGTEGLPRRFWLGAALSFAGVGLVALGAAGAARRRRRRDPVRDPDRRDLGRLLDPDHPADAALLAVADQRRRAAALLGRRSRSSGCRRRDPRTGSSAGRSGRSFLFATLGPLVDHEHPLVQVARPHRRVARDARDEPAAVRRRPLRGRAARRDDRRRPGGRRPPDRGRDPRRAAALARLAGRVTSVPAAKYAAADEPAATHRARLGRRRRRR